MKEIIKSIKKGWLDFIVLGLVLILGGIFFLSASHNLYRQKISLIFTAIAYVIWGVVHHWRQGDLNLKITFEYVFMAIIGASLAYFVLLSQ